MGFNVLKQQALSSTCFSHRSYNNNYKEKKDTGANCKSKYVYGGCTDKSMNFEVKLSRMKADTWLQAQLSTGLISYEGAKFLLWIHASETAASNNMENIKSHFSRWIEEVLGKIIIKSDGKKRGC